MRRIVSPQVPTQRLRGPIRTGRQPAGAFAVKMHSKENAAHLLMKDEKYIADLPQTLLRPL